MIFVAVTDSSTSLQLHTDTARGDRACQRYVRAKRRFLSQQLLYPLRFEPIYQYRLWGGRRLADLLSAPLPGDGPIGEAWVLSDRDDHPSLIADGPLKGRTLDQLLKQFPEQILGQLGRAFPPIPIVAEVPRRS